MHADLDAQQAADRRAAAAPDARAARLGRIGAVLTAAVVASSALVRHDAAGFGCTPWPHCFGAVEVAAGAAITAVRVVHRFAAAGTLGLVLMLVFLAWPERRARPRAFAQALALLGVVLWLAGLGVVTAGARLPAIALGNLLGGFALLALFARLGWPRAADAPLRAPAVVALVAWAAQAALGALLSATYAGPHCGATTDCLAAAAGGWDASALNPWREPLPGGPGTAAAATLHVAHRGVALLAGAAALALAWLGWRRGRRGAAVALAALVALQAALGALVVAGSLPLPVVLLHSFGAGAGMALIAREV